MKKLEIPTDKQTILTERTKKIENTIKQIEEKIEKCNNNRTETKSSVTLYKDQKTGAILPESIGQKAEQKEIERITQEIKEKYESLKEKAELWKDKYIDKKDYLDNSKKKKEKDSEGPNKNLAHCWKCDRIEEESSKSKPI